MSQGLDEVGRVNMGRVGERGGEENDKFIFN